MLLKGLCLHCDLAHAIKYVVWGEVDTLSSQVRQGHAKSIPEGNNRLGQQMRLGDKPQGPLYTAREASGHS